MLPVHPALVDDQCHEVPVSATIPQLPNHAVVDIRPGDQAAATEVDSWLQAYAASRDPELRERIILAYLGLTDRLAADELLQRLGRSPTTPEFAEHLELGEEEVLEGLAAAGSRLEVSLDQPAGDEGDRRLGDLVAAPGAREEPEDLLALPGLVAELPELEREVIVLRFFQDLDQYEIAARVGYSQMHVSRLQRRALARMRTQLIEP